MRLDDAVARLDQDCSGDAACFNNRREIVREIIAIEHAKVARHPWIIEAPDLPEVLVGIDHWDRKNPV
jgi:hypothetical protein